MKFEELSPKAQSYYAAVNIRLGLAPDECTHGPIETYRNGETIVFSSDPLESDVPPKIMAIASIAQMNKMVGIPDHIPDDHLYAPPPLGAALRSKLENANSSNEFWGALTDEDTENIKDAALVYVLGNSRRVAEYEPLINALMFPTKIACFCSTEDLIIKTPVVVKGNAPVCWCYNNIIIEPGGSLRAEVDMKIDCNNFKTAASGLEATDTGDYLIDVSVPDYSGPATEGVDAGKGKEGDPGPDAVEAQDMRTKGCPWVCVTEAQNGKQGGKGGDGTVGSPGGRGANQGTFTLTVKEAITGKLIVSAGGGNGQDGGKGGNGGPGGPGGPGGAAGAQGKCMRKALQGTQGPGGQGAKGGKAGDGGDGNIVTVFYNILQGGVTPIYKGGKKGNPGRGGDVGPGNPAGGSDGNGDPGENSKFPAKIVVQPAPEGLF